MKRRDFLSTSLVAASAGIAGGLIDRTSQAAAEETIAQQHGDAAQQHGDAAQQGGDAAQQNEDAAQPSFALLAPPILQWADPNRADIVALTSAPAACHIEMRQVEADAAGEKAERDTRRITSHQDGLIHANETFHRIRADRLAPGRTYEYVLVAREIIKFDPYKVTWGAEIRSKPYRFTTPRQDANEVRFAVLNDLHKNTELIHRLFDLVEQRDPAPEFLMLNGDILSHIANESDIRAIYDLPGSYASTHPTMWVRGNHECRGQFARYMDRYLAKPDGRYYYTFRRGPVQVLVLDCGEDKPDDHWAYSGLNDFETFRAEEEAWLDTVLASDQWDDAPWRVLVVHIPVEKGTLRPNGKVEPYRQRWAEKLEKAGLDLELSAHYHRVLFTDRSAEQQFPIVVGGGPKLDSAVAFHVRANANVLEVEMVDAKGELVKRTAWKH